ncbi:MAG: isochorismatase family protein [Terriglobales bacterium]
MAIQSETVLWEVDTQRDFMLPGGALYVPGAERLIPNLRKLVDLARAGRAFLISSACQHTPDDPEFSVFPPHCVRGTLGAQLIPEARTDKLFTVPNDPQFVLPSDFRGYEQVLLEKQTLDVFENPNTARIVDRFPSTTEFVIFGVVTEYCVRCAANGLLARGRRAAIVVDAIETLKKEVGQETTSELVAKGVRLVSTEEVLAQMQ